MPQVYHKLKQWMPQNTAHEAHCIAARLDLAHDQHGCPPGLLAQLWGRGVVQGEDRLRGLVQQEDLGVILTQLQAREAQEAVGDGAHALDRLYVDMHARVYVCVFTCVYVRAYVCACV